MQLTLELHVTERLDCVSLRFLVNWFRFSFSSYVPMITLTSVGTEPSDAVFDMNTTDTRVTITGLEPGTEYNVFLATRDNFGELNAGPELNTVTCKRLVFILIQSI